MLKNIKISTKISLLVLLLTGLAIVAISFFTQDYNKKNIYEKYAATLGALAETKSDYVDQQAERIKQALVILQNSDVLKNQNSPAPEEGGMDLMDMFGGGDEAADESESDSLAGADPVISFLQTQKELFGFESIMIITPKGSIIKSTEGEAGNFTDPDGATFDKGRMGFYFSAVYKEAKDYFGFATAPIEIGGETQLIVIRYSLNDLNAYLTNYTGLGKTGETILLRQDPILKTFTIITPTRLDPNGPIRVVENKELVETLQTEDKAKEKLHQAKDTRGEEVYRILKKIDNTGWVLLTKISKAEADSIDGSLTRVFMYAGICIMTLALLLTMTLSRALTRPLLDVRNTLNLVAQGVLPETTEEHSKDEFGQMAYKVDELVVTLKNNAQFAQRIGEGKYDSHFTPASENDLLGMSLINMRQNLVENEKRDNERNWIVRGVAGISEVLRMHDSIEGMGDDVIKFILDKIEAIQGAFYVVNDDDEAQKLIEMRASYAYGRKKYLKRSFRFAEGLVGQAVAEKDTIVRTEIPDEYVTLTSGLLGDQRPTALLIVPLITNEEVYGVLEFAGFKKFTPSQINFVKELSLILARTIFNIKVNERTRNLLEESQKMSNELQEKGEVLRQNAEEMQATSEELERSNKKLEEQIEEVNRTQKRMQLLLENASEVITIYEDDESIRYISPSVETILGYEQKELIGHSDIENVKAEYHEVMKGFFQKLREHPEERASVQYEYKTKSGEFIWIETTGTNAMSNPAIHGFILNSRDITERRRAEQETRMRSKMQALSENSPDLITRLENEAISYINPVIESYTGQKPSLFLNRKMQETDIDKAIIDGWLRVLEEVNTTNKTVATEMDFPSELGQRVMQVNAIPEFDENSKLESVLVVSHDITERKMIELEIQNKNKKITESINYAKRIQTAILPNNRVINKTLPDSFILYKPRDVVSGDFPWYMQVKEDIYIAAVDCTGHGVPGALLSLIGYFLLNDIVRSRKITEPGIILDLLDEGVTKTLRQDEDSTTKDGMDIALCKINMDTREVEYAGAHRPLYAMKNGVMEEVKGNKFPIGGGIYKNQTNFTNTKLTLGKGDSIYFSSDGFPDQFGGPEGRKFGPKKVREVIERVHKLPMPDAHTIFDEEWENWRGEQKQTDDVLLIGIKF
ncbi:PAS domain S-box protein [Chryseotalea sanaruensis]|uniref:PAS domain S-box protein n=1 Tax=Chryseotalea sanaruensis TaxID=2482724 RepID=A0A401U5M3_9BACT|nr:PAS domain S-box protein [Chryseotalea sanaruensis]GCC50172.1 PAS domain S-box protein [Chryseotalea sanaruensis]